MKCFYRPKDDLVAICKSCGRGICQECTMIVSGASCKTCVQDSRVPPQTGQIAPEPTAAPRPSGIPSRTRFIVGAIGAIISGVAALLLPFGSGFSFYSMPIPYYGYGNIWAYSIASIASIMLGVGLILAGIGYLGIERNYGLSGGTAGFALSTVVAVFFFSGASISLIAASLRYPYYALGQWYVMFIVLSDATFVLFGVMQIVWGIAHINSRRYTGNSGLAMATGIILIISGALTASVLMSFVGLVLFFVCGMLALLVFLMSKVPKQQSL